MSDFVILHLSDLHFTKGAQSPIHSNLLKDLEEQIKKIDNQKIIVAVSGDLLHKGKKDGLLNAKRFFENMVNVLGEQLLDILIVPGNHDKFRSTENSLLIPAYRSYIDSHVSYPQFSKIREEMNSKGEVIGVFDQESMSSLWKYQKATYKSSGYYELIDHIYSLYESKNKASLKKIAEDTYGVYSFSLNKKKYCFILLNTAWSCLGSNDTRHLILGDFQIDAISKQYNSLLEKAEEFDLTFVIGHHPIECLYGFEQDKLFSKLMSVSGINLNAYLCGHIHNRNLINWSDTHSNVHTLITGIGWPLSERESVGDNFYSYYIVNSDFNSLDIVVRNTLENKKFGPDFKLYLSEDKKMDVISRPIRQNISTGGFKLSTAKNVLPVMMYADNNKLNEIVSFINSLQFLLLDGYNAINDSINTLLLSKEESGVNPNVTKFYTENVVIYDDTKKDSKKHIKTEFDRESRFMEFESVLNGLLEITYSHFFKNVEENDIIRIHFRYLSDKETKMYSNLCSYFGPNEKIDAKYSLKDKQYCDLSEAAYNLEKESRCLIYSINSTICTKKLKANKWHDYITIIPRFYDNKYSTRKGEIPYFTAGVAISSSKYEEILYLLNICKFDNIIGTIIQHAIDLLAVDIDDFCNWIHEKTVEEAKEK